jgi:hypothetical protein
MQIKKVPAESRRLNFYFIDLHVVSAVLDSASGC